MAAGAAFAFGLFAPEADAFEPIHVASLAACLTMLHIAIRVVFGPWDWVLGAAVDWAFKYELNEGAQ